MKLLLILCFLLSSCASYVNNIHKQIDRENSRNKDGAQKQNKFGMYRNNGMYPREHQDRVTLTKSVIADDSVLANNYEPRVKRDYRSNQQRVTAKDLNDNDSSGSLWTNDKSDGYLFSKDVHKRGGDIIVVKVQAKLKNDITAELKRAFPAPKKKLAKDSKKGDKNKKDSDKNADVAKDDNKDNKEEEHASDETKIYDQISSVVVEEVSKDYILLRGQKEVIFRSNKHAVELQVLVPRKEVLEDDSVLSAHILESNIVVLR